MINNFFYLHSLAYGEVKDPFKDKSGVLHSTLSKIQYLLYIDVSPLQLLLERTLVD